VTQTENFVAVAPHVAHWLVYTSTTGYGPAIAALYALSADTDAIRWRFLTIHGPWRIHERAGGGGAWNTASID
jgi:hypothetical protein